MKNRKKNQAKALIYVVLRRFFVYGFHCRFVYAHLLQKRKKTAQPLASCAEIYGLNYSIVYVKVRTFALIPFTKTAALIVVFFFTVIGAIYSGELAVGAFPFVV